MSLSWIIAAFALSADGPAPVAWSPDGRWLAYVDVEGGEPLADGWLFAVDRGGDAPRPDPAVSASRLWAASPGTGESVLLDRCNGWHSAPAWGPGGMAIAFARTRSDARPPMLEVIIQDSPDRQRILLSRPCPAEGVVWGSATIPPGVTWSPDGQLLTVPMGNAAGFDVVRAENGRTVASFPGMIAPSWSPVGEKLAFLAPKPGGEAELCWSELGTRNTGRAVLSLGKAWQPPRWKGDGKSILVAQVQSMPIGIGGGELGGTQGKLVEYVPETGQLSTLHSLIDRQVSAAHPLDRVVWTIDADLDGLFYAASIGGQPTEIGYFLVRRQESRDRFNPVDPILPIAELCLSPDERSLAIRFATPAGLSPPAVFRRDDRRLTLLYPDRDAAERWLTLLVRASAAIVKGEMPLPHLGERQVARPSLIPLPQEDETNGPYRARLRRLASQGLEAIREAERLAPVGEASRHDEERLFFLALGDSWGEALKVAEDLEGRDPSPGDRWLALRAQLELSRGESEAARGILEFLRGSPSPRRLEETPAGSILAPIPDSARWIDLLQDRLEHPTTSGEGMGDVVVPHLREEDFAPPVIELEIPNL